MNTFLLKLSFCTAIIFAVSCESPVKKENASIRFHTMLDNYWHGLLKLQPLDATQFGDNSLNDQFVNNCTQAYRNEVRNFYLRYQDSLKKINPDKLDGEDVMSYNVLKYDVEIQLEKTKYDTWKIPFTPIGDASNTVSANIVLAMGQYGSGESSQPFKTVKDYDNWLLRVHGYTIWCDSAIQNFRQGMASNYLLPKALVIKMIDICNGLISKEDTSSLFYGPIKNLPVTFSNVERTRIINAYKDVIKNELNPTHTKMAAFLKDEYLPKARTTSGVGDLPDGLNYYKLCVKEWTTTDKTLDEIYTTGLNEVKRIRMEMENTKNSTGFKGDLNSFFHFMKTDKQFMPFKKSSEVLDSFQHIYDIIKPSLTNYFVLFPKSRFEIRQTEAFRAASASIEYLQGTPDGSRPGVFYIPILDATTFNITSGMESTFLHEAIPGHHYQSSLQMEDTLLPAFRRFKWYGAYGEGWALYSESLGKELGLYTNPYQLMGALGDEMHRAIRLVVDIGIHSKGMTREEAIAYMMQNEPVEEQSAVAETERYMGMPGQALSYKIGALKLQELRENYAKQLGAKFDIREFHKEVLNSGCLPLSVLEDKLNRWAKTQQ
ncbi:MAG TPA: DUF885 domain-containing protein [Bacteroidia bacterium]|nr:DUF885 domain-containing protein [Bacteroidia bacterium]